MNKKNSDLEMKTKLEVFYSLLKTVKTQMMLQMFLLIKINNKKRGREAWVVNLYIQDSF
jgi:hypothetical protein